MQDAGFTTKDIGLCAALAATGQPIKTILWKDNIAYFLFPDRVTCDELQQRYYLGQLSVDARTYYDTLRGIKRRLYSHERPR
jgi:hypothetical protein